MSVFTVTTYFLHFSSFAEEVKAVATCSVSGRENVLLLPTSKAVKVTGSAIGLAVGENGRIFATPHAGVSSVEQNGSSLTKLLPACRLPALLASGNGHIISHEQLFPVKY